MSRRALAALTVLALAVLLAVAWRSGRLDRGHDATRARRLGPPLAQGAPVLPTVTPESRQLPHVATATHLREAEGRTGHGGQVVELPAVALYATPDGVQSSLSVLGRPSIAPALADAILRRDGSPLAGLGSYMDAVGRRWGVDPAFALAFALYFDRLLPLPVAAHNVGHITAGPGEPDLGGFRVFPSWRGGLDAWFALIGGLYARRWHLTTLDRILPVYAPGGGRRGVEAALNGIDAMVLAWRAEA